jgi:hypothetical protein
MGERMNRRQKFALRHHCRLGGETVHPRFLYMAGLASIVLTVNSGYE